MKNFDNSFGQFVLKDFFNRKAESKIGSFGSISKRNLNDASNFSSLSLSIGGGVGGVTGGGVGGLTIEGLAGGLGRKYL